MNDSAHVEMTINGRRYAREVEARKTLADFLREDLDLTGTHLGCEHGVCGACTVLVDGKAIRACLVFAIQLDGSDVTTIEGLAPEGEPMTPAQQGFMECHGLQCGFCTSGFLMALAELWPRRAEVEWGEVEEAISGHLCRCTGYAGIRAAARAAFAGPGTETL